MKQTRLEISVGVFVLVGLAAVAYLALKIGAGVLVGTDTYVVQARFQNVSGLAPGAKVVISGVTIGSVDAVTLDPQSFGAVVRLRVRADVRLPVDSLATVRTNGLLGDKHLAIRPGAEAEHVAPGGALARTEAATDLEAAITQFTGGGAAGDSLGDDAYLLHARFTNAAGVVAGCRVAIAGVTVGVVDRVHLNPEDFTAIVDFRLRAEVKLPLDSLISIKSSSLIGGKYLAVQLGGDPDVARPGDTLIETESALDLESIVSRIAFGTVQPSSSSSEPTSP